MLDSIFAVIVTYYPGDRTCSLISVLEQEKLIDKIILVDNTDAEMDIINKIHGDKVIIERMFNNKGIAFAQNHGFNLARSMGASWVITFDQDTIPSKHLLEKYEGYIKSCNDIDKIGILNTDYYDIGKKGMSFGNQEPIEVEVAISSGSLMQLSLIETVGGMKEDFFIDQVDNDFCYRVRRMGFKIIILPGNDMEHSMGEIKKNHLFNKSFYTYNQSPIRTYYRTRNSIWMIREYKDKNYSKAKRKALVIDFLKLFVEKKSGQKIFMFFKGLKDGLFCQYE